MKIEIKDKTENRPVSEMFADSETAFVTEMITDPAKLADLVPISGLADKARAMAVALKDEEPEYPVVRVEEGWSRTRKLYSAETLQNIAEQVNQLEPVGHLGHIPDDQISYAFPDVQTTWLGAVTKKESSQDKTRKGQMVTAMYVAGYNHPGAKIRGYIKSRAVRGTSWAGNGDLVKIPGQGVEVKNFVLKHLDWARKLSEGMPTSQIVAVTNEMEGKMEKDLNQVTPDELKREAPNLYQLIVNEIQTDAQTQISEMEGKVEDAKKAQTLVDKCLEVVGISDPEKLIDELTNLKEKVGVKAAAMVKSALDTLLEEKVPDENRRALVKRLLPITEMESKAEECKDTEAVTKLVTEMTDDAFNKDDLIKEQISEMTPPNVRRREDLQGKNEGLKGNTYVTERSAVTL